MKHQESWKNKEIYHTRSTGYELGTDVEDIKLFLNQWVSYKELRKNWLTESTGRHREDQKQRGKKRKLKLKKKERKKGKDVEGS